jgi:hypothetical protein
MKNFLLRVVILFISFSAISAIVDLGIRKMPLNSDLLRNWVVVGLFFSVTTAWFLGKPFRSIMNRKN